jgi:hypothetical protein
MDRLAAGHKVLTIPGIRSLEGMKAISVFRNRSQIVSLGLIHPVGYSMFEEIASRR